MKIIKILTVAALILSFAVYGVSVITEYAEKDDTLPEIYSDREVLEATCATVGEHLTDGLSAKDGNDGDLTAQIVAGSATRFVTPGKYDVTYAVFDSSNQMATLTRRVHLTDYHSPRFTLSQPLVFDIDAASSVLIKKSIGAQDLLDGDLSEWVVVTDTTLTSQQTGDYEYAVQVSNSYGDTAQLRLPVHVVDFTDYKLRINLASPIVYITPGEAFNPRNFLEGLYDKQGNKLDPGLVRAEGNVDVNTPGMYEVKFQAADEAGNLGITWLTVVVQEGA